MTRNALWLMILIWIAPLWLAAQTQPAPVQNPSKLSTWGQELGMEMAAAERHGQMNTTSGPEIEPPQSLKNAANRPPMRLKDFEDLALADNPTLKQASELEQRSAAESRQAGLYPNPSAGYEGSEIRGGSFAGGEQGAFVQQTIILGGKLGLRKRVFQDQQREDEAALSEQHYRMFGDVDQRFYSALAAQALVKVRENLLKLTLDASRTARQLANVGQADEPDVLQA
ncbi:MAG TPA: TolC family protein, partial [Terriglobia bacterium]|nr:TolC family protein [Terriglobia bacterium]